ISIDPPKSSIDHPLLVAIDVRAEHCAQVLVSAMFARMTYTSASDVPEVPEAVMLGLFPETVIAPTIFGLFDYMSLFPQMLALEQCPDAIVMSVDFGLACFKGPSGRRLTTAERHGPVKGVPSVAAYSFPIFETALAVVLDGCTEKNSFFHWASGIKA